MTNREWLQTLTDEEFARIVRSCKCCIGQTDIEKCSELLCSDGCIEWLKQEHTEAAE